MENLQRWDAGFSNEGFIFEQLTRFLELPNLILIPPEKITERGRNPAFKRLYSLDSVIILMNLSCRTNVILFFGDSNRFFKGSTTSGFGWIQLENLFNRARNIANPLDTTTVSRPYICSQLPMVFLRATVLALALYITQGERWTTRVGVAVFVPKFQGVNHGSLQGKCSFQK